MDSLQRICDRGERGRPDPRCPSDSQLTSCDPHRMRSSMLYLSIILLSLGLNSAALAESPLPPLDATVEDVPNDNGTALLLRWTPPLGAGDDTTYDIEIYTELVEKPSQFFQMLNRILPLQLQLQQLTVTLRTISQYTRVPWKSAGFRFDKLKPGQECQVSIVTVLADGFECHGQRYKSLTAVAKAVTGKHWNGYHFFGLRTNGGDR